MPDLIGIATATVLAIVAVGWGGQNASARVVQIIELTPHELRIPDRIALGPSGLLYVRDGGNQGSSPVRISIYSPSGRVLRRWRIPHESPNVPHVVDSAGNVYVVGSPDPTTLAYSIVKYSPTGQLLSTRWADRVWDGHRDAPGLAGDGHGHVLVAFEGNIDTFDEAGQLLASWQYDAPGDFTNITGLAVATSGMIYVADRSGVAVLDSAGHVVSRIVPAGDHLGQVSEASLIAGPAGSLYALQGQREVQGAVIQKFGPDGRFLGAVASDRGVQWLSAAIANDGSIYVPQYRYVGVSGVVLKLAPITTVDLTAPSITVESFSQPPSARAKGVLGRLTYTLSEDASFRIVLLHRASTTNRDSREFGRYFHSATLDKNVTPAGTHRLLLRPRSFGYTRRRPPGRYRLVLVARDDAGSESKLARVNFSIARP